MYFIGPLFMIPPENSRSRLLAYERIVTKRLLPYPRDRGRVSASAWGLRSLIGNALASRKSFQGSLAPNSRDTGARQIATHLQSLASAGNRQVRRPGQPI